jgi:uncharacterized protein YdeI (YjbR/CyaY-like superfamily)
MRPNSAIDLSSFFGRTRRRGIFFRVQAPSYQRTATCWVISAKKKETKRKRLERLIEDSARGQSIDPLKRPARPK